MLHTMLHGLSSPRFTSIGLVSGLRLLRLGLEIGIIAGIPTPYSHNRNENVVTAQCYTSRMLLLPNVCLVHPVWASLVCLVWQCTFYNNKAICTSYNKSKSQNLFYEKVQFYRETNQNYNFVDFTIYHVLTMF